VVAGGRAEVLIVGGGPAGLAAALAVRQQGLDVMVADGARSPIDKACGEGVMPNGIAALRRLGIEISRDAAVPFRGIRFIASDLAADACFVGDPGWGIRRTELHRLLAARAAAAGVRLSWDTPVRGLTAEGVVLDGGPVACRWIIGADGERSQVREWAGLGPPGSPSQRFGFRRHFAVAPWTDAVEVYWCRGAQVFVTPVAPSEVCVALISRSSRGRLGDVLAACPELERRLAGAPATTPERGAISASRRLAAVTRGRLALIGEASGSIDAVTGEGLSVTFHHALALAEALAAGDLGRYEAAHRRILRVPALMARLLLAMDRSPWLCRRALRAFAAEAGLFSRLLALHVGTAASPGRAVGSLCSLGWRLLTV